MIKLLDKIKLEIKKMNKISCYPDNSFIYYDRPKIFSMGFFPDGRYVFHAPKEEISNLKGELISQMKAGNLNAFKYALDPLPGEENPALIVYAEGKKAKIKAEEIIKNLGVVDYEWKEGNNITSENLKAETKYFKEAI